MSDLIFWFSFQNHFCLFFLPATTYLMSFQQYTSSVQVFASVGLLHNAYLLLYPAFLFLWVLHEFKVCLCHIQVLLSLTTQIVYPATQNANMFDYSPSFIRRDHQILYTHRDNINTYQSTVSLTLPPAVTNVLCYYKHAYAKSYKSCIV